METKTAPEKAEIPLFNELVDKNNYAYKVVNFDNPKICEQVGIIEVEALKRSNLKQPRVSFHHITDPDTGIIYGIPLGNDPKTGELLFEQIVLEDFHQFDLSIPSDRKRWCVISRHPILEGSPLASKSKHIKPSYRVIDKNKQAERTIRMSKARRRATTIAEEMTGVELYDMSANLGLSNEFNNLNTLLAAVLEKAEKEPEDFLSIYDDINRNVITAFNRARATGLITLDVTNGFMWKGTYPLGSNEAMCVKALLNNATLLMNVDLESKQRSTFFKNHAKPEDKEAITLQPHQLGQVKEHEPKDKGFVMDKELDEKLKKLDEITAARAEELEKSKGLNEKMEAFLKSQEPKEEIPDYNKMELSELQKIAYEQADFMVAMTTTNRKVLIEKIMKALHKK